jgi:hypothetical protein
MIYSIKGELPMPARAERASRLRLALKSLLADCQRQLDGLLPLRQLVKGSVYELQTRCGKPTCHCASDDGPRHTSTVLSWSEKGRTRLRTLPAGERVRFQQLTEDYRRFRQARAALVKLQRRMLATLDQLEKTLRLPPPQPARRKRRQT